MRVIRDCDSTGQKLPTPVLTVGNFDGVHLGHQAILKETVRAAHMMGIASAALTFDPHPRVVSGEKTPSLLTTLPQKLDLLDNSGIDVAIICPYQRIYRYGPSEFFSEILVARIGVKHLVEGEDFTFGKGKTGSLELLKELGRQYGVGVTITPPVTFEGRTISSTWIRTCIQQGDVSRAMSLLGRPYMVEGRRIRGKGRGRVLGYPTVNLSPENGLLPGIGIYAVKVECAQSQFLGAANLGFNPTFEGDRFSFEIHLLDFEGEIGNDRLRVFFYEKLRNEIKFDSAQALILQIKADVARVREIFGSG